MSYIIVVIMIVTISSIKDYAYAPDCWVIRPAQFHNTLIHGIITYERCTVLLTMNNLTSYQHIIQCCATLASSGGYLSLWVVKSYECMCTVCTCIHTVCPIHLICSMLSTLQNNSSFFSILGPQQYEVCGPGSMAYHCCLWKPHCRYHCWGKNL